MKRDDDEWVERQPASAGGDVDGAVKSHVKRMDPSFSEKSLGFKSFGDFLRSRSELVELDERSTTRMVWLRGEGEA